MNRQLRLLIVIAFIVIILGVVAAFVLPNLGNTDDPADTTDTLGTEGDPQTVSTPLPTQPPIETVEIVVALQNIPRGAEVPPDPNMIGLRAIPLEFLPQNALIGEEGLDFAIGQRARFDLFQEYPILSNMVVPSLAELASIGSDLAATIPPNRRAVAVPVDRLTSVAFGVQPGDRVDIIVSFLFVEIDEDFQALLPNDISVITRDPDNLIVIGEPLGGDVDLCTFTIHGIRETCLTAPSETPRPRLATQITIQNALVVGVGNFPLDGILFQLEPTAVPVEVATTSPQAPQQNGEAVPTAIAAIQPPDMVTLAVTPQEAVLLTYYIEANIPITFALRAANDTSQVPTTQVTLGYILNTYNIQLPARLPYSIEPAIRSIRSLRDIATNTTNLTSEE